MPIKANFIFLSILSIRCCVPKSNLTPKKCHSNDGLSQSNAISDQYSFFALFARKDQCIFPNAGNIKQTKTNQKIKNKRHVFLYQRCDSDYVGSSE